MKFPARVTTRAEAKQLVDDLFKLPLRHDLPKDTLGVSKLRQEKVDNLRALLTWLLTQPKVYKRAHFDLTYGAAHAFERAMNDLHFAFSSAHFDERVLPGIRRLRSAG
ncbi:MAG: hypothetical protein QOE70_403 [Chthoniobacter sp.]|jgi:hypothetical protein|nr:hypothetical protein [Chthoniobacter sp.]